MCPSVLGCFYLPVLYLFLLIGSPPPLAGRSAKKLSNLKVKCHFLFAAIAVTLCELLPNKGAAADAVASSAAVAAAPASSGDAAPADDELTRLRTSKKSTQHIYEGCLKEKEAA